MEPTFFATPEEFRAWLRAHHETESELLVGFYKKGTGRPSITWPESVDEALCVGWIDGVRRSLGDEAYTIRFTPRKAKSNWSAVNIKRMKQLIAEGRVAKPGLEAFERRDKTKAMPYSYENRDRIKLDPAFEKRLKGEPKAWAFFDALPPGYKRLMIFRVMDAKKEETRERRFLGLLEMCRKEQRVPLV